MLRIGRIFPHRLGSQLDGTTEKLIVQEGMQSRAAFSPTMRDFQADVGQVKCEQFLKLLAEMIFVQALST